MSHVTFGTLYDDVAGDPGRVVKPLREYTQTLIEYEVVEDPDAPSMVGRKFSITHANWDQQYAPQSVPLPPPATSTTVTKLAGDNQTGPAGAKLAARVGIQVMDNGVPVTGAPVTWAAKDGGSVVQLPTSVATDENGTSKVEWMLGPGQGAQLLTATTSGVTVTFAATAAAAGPTPVPTPTPPPTSGLIYSAHSDFSSGNLHPFVASGNDSILGSADTKVVDDPTGLVGGKVVQIRYQRGGGSADVNRSFEIANGVNGQSVAVKHGDTVKFTGTFLIPQPQPDMVDAQRKLVYFQVWGNTENHFFVKVEQGVIKVPTHNPATGGLRVWQGGGVSYGVPHELRIEGTINSAPGVADGVFRLWIDGAQRLNMTDWMAYVTSNWWIKFKIGQQAQHLFSDASVFFDELRFWSDITLEVWR